MKDPCPVCDNMEHLSSMDMTPELVAEMAAAEPVSDYAGDKLVENSLAPVVATDDPLFVAVTVPAVAV